MFGEGLTWVARRENPWFFEESSVSAIADIVRTSHGPSGANVDYVTELAKALLDLGIADPEVEALAAAL